MNIIPSALKLTPATKSMINKAQYCQRHWLCNIIPLTHSHGACNLVLVLEISLQLWDTEGMSMAQTFLSYFYLFILYLLVPCGKCLKDKNRGLGFRRGGHDKRKITWWDFILRLWEYWQYVEVIVFPWLFIFLYVDLCGPLYVFKAGCGVIHSLCCACTAAHQFTALPAAKKRVLCRFIASLLLSTKTSITIIHYLVWRHFSDTNEDC